LLSIPSSTIRKGKPAAKLRREAKRLSPVQRGYIPKRKLQRWQSALGFDSVFSVSAVKPEGHGLLRRHSFGLLIP
jgi:hypothetical protein